MAPLNSAQEFSAWFKTKFWVVVEIINQKCLDAPLLRGASPFKPNIKPRRDTAAPKEHREKAIKSSRGNNPKKVKGHSPASGLLGPGAPF